jgi:hypothetical protein
MALVIVIFAILTLDDLWDFKQMVYYVIVHIKATYDDGNNTQVLFE